MIAKVIGLATASAIAAVAWFWTPALSGSAEIPLGGGSRVGSPSSSSAPVSRPTDRPAVLGGFNLRREFALPPLHTGRGDPATQIANETQVFQRAQLLNIDGGTAADAWALAAGTATAARGVLPSLLRQPLREVIFTGATLSELSAVIATAGPAPVTFASRSLQADTTLTITGQGLVLDFSGAAIEVGKTPLVWLIAVVRARDIAVINAKINSGTNGFLVDSGSNIAIEGNDVQGLTKNGIVVTGPSSSLSIRGNHLHDLGRAGIMLHGPVRTALLENNEIDHLRGHSNWHAGILLTGRRGNIAADPDAFFLPDHY